jgi:hypothetical protein
MKKNRPGGHLEIWFLPTSFPAFHSPTPTFMANIKRICQHLQILERRQKGLW